MGRKRKQTDIEDSISAANGTPGHNSGPLTDDERRALTLHHKRLYEAADSLVEKAKAERTAVADQAKSDLGKGALGDIKDMITYGDDKKLRADLDRRLRLARWLGLPIGTQLDMIDVPVDDRAAADGKTAGMAGLPCDPPRHHPPSAHQKWIAAWHEGQAVLASAFLKRKPKDETEAAQRGAALTTEPQPDQAPAH